MSSSAPPSHAQMRAQMVHASERATLPLQLAPAQREPLPARRGPSPTRRRVQHAARAAEAVVAFQSGGGHDHAAHATAAGQGRKLDLKRQRLSEAGRIRVPVSTSASKMLTIDRRRRLAGI